MEDRFGRKIDYLRISVTDRCNLRCLYCMPPEGVKPKPRQEILRFEEILTVVEAALELGINRFRLTGGEPLLRKGIIPFIKAMALLPGIEDIAITTNGLLLHQLGEQLKEAGARRLNISLDTINPEKYRKITGGGDFHTVWEGITTALELGFTPVKINVVALNQINDEEWADLARLTLDRPLHIRFIELMPVGTSWQLAGKNFAACSQVKSEIEKKLGELTPVTDIQGNGPAEYYRLPGAQGTIGFIHAMSSHFCASCNRLRLTADGKLRPCLHDRREVDLREAVRSGATGEELQELFRRALQLKPANYHEATGAPAAGRGMAQIGG
ncbi:MAG TPA: GTP 3',8-cyclase MoaA [Syntrophomonadaceae bacterium]|nr:GTP 3',8-cyclase MoaA [Syntrophomonadaceae bacterium]